MVSLAQHLVRSHGIARFQHQIRRKGRKPYAVAALSVMTARAFGQPPPKLRKSVLPWAIPLGVSGFGLLLLGIFSSVFPAEYMVASTVIAGNQEPADRIYRGLAGFLKCNNLEWLFRLCLVIAIGSLLAGLWQKGVMKRFEDAVDHKLDELGEKNRDASA